MDDDTLLLGYIKAKFPILSHVTLAEEPYMDFCKQFKSMRVTGHFVYVAIGHESIPDNHIGQQLIREIESLRGKITRLDFCVDVAQRFDIEKYYNTMYAVYKDADVKRRIGTPCLLTSPNGTTCYIGKRSSARMIRIYDKRAEVLYRKKVDMDMDLTRFEIEVKREQIAKYKSLYMSGNTQAIVDDMAERYALHWLSRSPNKIKPFEIPEKRSSELAFVERYKAILKRAWDHDKEQFIETIGVEL